MLCSICLSSEFTEFNGRKNARCTGCGSLERHRAVYTVLLNNDIINYNSVILHMAPERCLVDSIKNKVNADNYVLADIDVPYYKERFDLDCVYLDAAKSSSFSDNFFDLIIHNHVLEHLTGTYKDHIAEMIRIIKPGKHIVFTVPFLKNIKNSFEGGEYLPSDAERKVVFGQNDHYKVFGRDFLYYLNTIDSITVKTFLLDSFSTMDTVFVLTKHK